MVCMYGGGGGSSVMVFWYRNGGGGEVPEHTFFFYYTYLFSLNELHLNNIFIIYLNILQVIYYVPN